MTLGKVAPFGRGQFSRSICALSWGNEYPSPRSQRGPGWKTTAFATLVGLSSLSC